jgi:hypothetical protein
MKNHANLYAFGRLTDEICNQFRTAAYVLAIYGKIDGGATTGATTHYTDARFAVHTSQHLGSRLQSAIAKGFVRQS